MESNELMPTSTSKDILINRDESILPNIITRFIEVLLLPVLALIAHSFYEETESRAWIVTIVASFIVISISYVGVDEYRRYRHRKRDIAHLQRHLSLTKQTRELEETTKLLRASREGELLSNTIQKVSQIQRGINLQYSKADIPTGWGYDQKWKILNSICDILKQDRRCYQGPRDYFKATLFKVITTDALELDCNFYPPGDLPKTERFDRNVSLDVRSTLFRCFTERATQIISNVPEESKKGADARWVELYQGQAKHYGSMICTPITIGERSAHTYRVISVLTIDTNRIDYFTELEEEKNFLAMLLSPFRQQLSFIYLYAGGFFTGDMTPAQVETAKQKSTE